MINFVPTMFSKSKVPALCGQRLLPALIDEIAVDKPDRVFASIPRSANVRDGFDDVSYRQLAAAINRCAWWIEKNLGKAKDLEALGYLGPVDLCYTIIFIACLKTGYTVSRHHLIQT